MANVKLCCKYGIMILLIYIVMFTVGDTEEIDNDWWKKTIVYQIYPRSFQDSDGDGTGDIQGIISRLDYFSYLHVNTIWVSPIYPSPFADFGYDVSDYVNISPLFGTLADFDQMVEQIHKRGMKLILDFIPNHTSDQHPWFIESRKGGEHNPYRDFYRWHDGLLEEDGAHRPPNNWLSSFGGSAWQWDEGRGQYYLHQYLPEQPDLDYRNPEVRREILKAIRFWIYRGVDGFRMAIRPLFETEEVVGMDEPRSFKKKVTEDQSGYLTHIYTQHLDEIHEVVREWRNMMDEYQEETGKHIYMVMEVNSPNQEDVMKYYYSGADQPFNFNLIHLKKSCDGYCVQQLVDKFLSNMPDGKWPSYVLGNHDLKRITTRCSPEYADALNIMLLTLPGTPTTYYGEEIGQRDVVVTYEETQDPKGKRFGKELYKKYTRDPCRAPMQWDSTHNAGFSTARKTWIPVHPDYTDRNVKTQQSERSGFSSIQIYRAAASLRQLPGFQSSSINYHVVNRDIFSYIRYNANSDDLYLVAINLGKKTATHSFKRPLGNPDIISGVIRVSTGASIGATVLLADITLQPGEALVLELLQPSEAQHEDRVNDKIEL